MSLSCVQPTPGSRVLPITDDLPSKLSNSESLGPFFTSLPRELLFSIMEKATPQATGAASLTCRTFRVVAQLSTRHLSCLFFKELCQFLKQSSIGERTQEEAKLLEFESTLQEALDRMPFNKIPEEMIRQRVMIIRFLLSLPQKLSCDLLKEYPQWFEKKKEYLLKIPHLLPCMSILKEFINIESEPNKEVKTKLLIENLQALFMVRGEEDGCALLHEVSSSTRSLPFHFLQICRTLAYRFMVEQRYELALKVAEDFSSNIEDDTIRAKAEMFSMIASRLERQGEHERAKSLIPKFEESNSKFVYYDQLIQHALDQHNLPQALGIAQDHFVDSEENNSALSAVLNIIADSLIEKHDDIDQATHVATMIQDIRWRSASFGAIARALAHRGSFDDIDQATHVATMIQDIGWRSASFGAIARALAHRGSFEDAYRILDQEVSVHPRHHAEYMQYIEDERLIWNLHSLFQ